MFYTFIFDSSGNIIGVHTYVEEPKTLPSNEIYCTQAQAQNPSSWMVSNGTTVVSNPVGIATSAKNAIQQAVEELLISVASAKIYASPERLMGYVNSSNATWKSDATAFIAWNDQLQAYSIAQQAITPVPSVTAFLAGIPAKPW